MEVEPEALTNAKAAPVAPKTAADPATPIVFDESPQQAVEPVGADSVSPEQPDFIRWSLNSPSEKGHDTAPVQPREEARVGLLPLKPLSGSTPRDILGDLSKAFDNAA